MSRDRNTLPGLLVRRIAATPDTPAFCVKDANGAWVPVTWAEFDARAEALALAFAAKGLQRGDRLAIFAPTCIEWEYAQTAALRLGAVVAGVDPAYPAATLEGVLREAGLAALAVKNAALLSRIPGDVLASLKLVACFEGAAPPSPAGLAMSDVLAHAPPAQHGAPQTDVRADDDALVVLTSGTTGMPKPLVYTHGQVVQAVEAITRAYPDIGAGERFLCWLPLANLFQRMIDFCAIALGITSYLVADPRTVMSEMEAVSPVLLIGVPRLYERVAAGIRDKLASLPGVSGVLGRTALRVAERYRPETASAADRLLRALADRLVFGRVRRAFGSRLRYLISGSAPMPVWLLHWYDAIGLPVYEAYGISENVIPVAMNRPGARRLGTVGRPLPENDVRIAEGEILVRSPGLSHTPPVGLVAGSGGYWPTGDLGALDAEGYLAVIGRKADTFKTSGGRWIAPQRIEAALTALPCVEQAVALGAGRPFVIALLSVDPGKRPSLQQDIAAATASLARDERPRAVILVERPFSIERGELTTNLKLRRHAIEQRFGSAIDEAYRNAAAARSGELVVLYAP